MRDGRAPDRLFPAHVSAGPDCARQDASTRAIECEEVAVLGVQVATGRTVWSSGNAYPRSTYGWSRTCEVRHRSCGSSPAEVWEDLIREAFQLLDLVADRPHEHLLSARSLQPLEFPNAVARRSNQ